MARSVKRTMRILELVSLHEGGLSHAQINNALKIPKSSLSLILADLAELEYLSLDPSTRRYRLGSNVLALANGYLSGLDIVKAGQPIVREVMAAAEESSSLVVRSGLEILVVCKENCAHSLQRTIEIGNRAPLYATAAGKVFLAHLPSEEIDEYLSLVELAPITPATITDPKLLRDELKAIRARGLSYCREEHNEEITAMAAPVFDLDGRLTASLVVSMPTIRFTPEKEARCASALGKASAKLSRQLGFNERRS